MSTYFTRNCSEVDQTNLQKFKCPGFLEGILKLRNDRHITSRERKRKNPGNEDVSTRPALARLCLTLSTIITSRLATRKLKKASGAFCNCKDNFATDPLLESKHCPAICSTLASLWNVVTHKIQCSSAVAGGLAMQRFSVRPNNS